MKALLHRIPSDCITSCAPEVSVNSGSAFLITLLASDSYLYMGKPGDFLCHSTFSFLISLTVALNSFNSPSS